MSWQADLVCKDEPIILEPNSFIGKDLSCQGHYDRLLGRTMFHIAPIEWVEDETK